MNNSIVIGWGRMNPPTKGHEKLIYKVVSTAKEIGAEHCIFLTQTQDPEKNPLDWKIKVRIAKAIFTGINISVNEELRTFPEVLEYLGETFDTVYLVTGEDRFHSYEWVNNYLDDFNLSNFYMISAGERDPDANDVTGISASDAREAVRNTDFNAFSSMIPDTVSFGLKQYIFDKLRKEII